MSVKINLREEESFGSRTEEKTHSDKLICFPSLGPPWALGSVFRNGAWRPATPKEEV
jgi:hypothetical protein